MRGGQGLTSEWSSGKSGPVGCPWEPAPSTWPGQLRLPAGATVSNHYPLSPLPVGPGGPDPLFGSSGGGIVARKTRARKTGARKTRARKTRARRKQRGGFRIVPQLVTNAARSVESSFAKGIATLQGKKTPVSLDPDPTVQPISSPETVFSGVMV